MTTLPTHPRTGLPAIAVLPSGRIVWPVLGGSEDGPPPADAEGQDAPRGEQRMFSQSELEAIIGDRLARERQKYSDYNDLKQAAARLAEIEEAGKTEAEKLRGQYEDILGKAARAEHQLRIERAARKHGLDDDALVFLTGETDDEVEANAAKLAELTKGRNSEPKPTPPGPRIDPSQGRGSSGDVSGSLDAGRERYRQRKTTPSGGRTWTSA